MTAPRATSRLHARRQAPGGDQWAPARPDAAIAAALRGRAARAKLRIGAPDDPEEAAADRVADRVMRMPAPAGDDDAPLRRTCADCEEEMRRTPAAHAPHAVPEAAVAALGPGRPLPARERVFFEPRFGQDLGHVTMHADRAAAASARAVNARAYAVGDDVVFGAGEYRPGTTDGRRLLAHELAHVAQGRRHVISRSWDDPDGPERARFEALERSLGEYGLRFTEDGEQFSVLIPPSAGPALGIHDLVPPPQRIHRSRVIETMRAWLPMAIRGEQQSALAQAARGPTIIQILNSAFAHPLSPSSGERLWVMGPDDTYTSRVRLWSHVTHQLGIVKRHLEANCGEWSASHRTGRDWRPTMTYPPLVDRNAWDDPAQDNEERGRWAIRPSGTGAATAMQAYSEYSSSGRVPDRLWTSAIGSFGLYVTVDSIDCENGSAVLNVWMYNNMDQESFGTPTNPLSWSGGSALNPRGITAYAAYLWSWGVDAQYMWWNWTEPHHWAPRPAP